MRIESRFLAGVATFGLAALTTAACAADPDYAQRVRTQLNTVDARIHHGPFQANWNSLAAYRTPDWFSDAKFGIFLHWGVYSVPAFANEWYSRNMYVKGSPAYEYHRAVYGPQSKFGYKDFIPQFTAAKFDAAAWVDRFVRAGHWLKGNHPLGQAVAGRKLGIVGLGRIGAAIATRAEAFKLQVSWHGPRPKPDAKWPYVADLVTLARDVDFLCVICPLTPQTFHLITREVIEALGPEGTLINVARGPVVDEPALVDALKTGKLGHAALDVFEDEPRVPEALFALENTVLLPHVGSATIETRTAMGQLVVDNLVAHFAGKPLLTRVA